jgi:hypothetical protein
MLGHSKARRLRNKEEKEKEKQEKQEENILNICSDRRKYRASNDTVTREVWKLKADFKFHLRFEVLMVVTLKTDQVWDVTPCRLVHTHFGGRAPPSSIFPKEGGNQVPRFRWYIHKSTRCHIPKNNLYAAYFCAV